MSFTAAFVEHIVAGCTALIWIGLLAFRWNRSFLDDAPTALALLLIPVLYAVGILIDWASYKLVQKYKLRKKIRDKVAKDFGMTTDDNVQEGMRVAVIRVSADLGREISIRQSRENIVRCTSLNCFVIALCGIALWDRIASSVTALIAFMSAGLSAYAWRDFVELTERYKYQCYVATEKGLGTNTLRE